MTSASIVTMIVWQDIRGCHGWHNDPEEMLDVVKEPMVSVGFFQAEDDNAVVLSATVDTHSGNVDDTIVIPHAVILKRADIDLFDEEDDADAGGDEYLVVGEDTAYADLFDPPDSTTVTSSHPEDTPHCAGPI